MDAWHGTEITVACLFLEHSALVIAFLGVGVLLLEFSFVQLVVLVACLTLESCVRVEFKCFVLLFG